MTSNILYTTIVGFILLLTSFSNAISAQDYAHQIIIGGEEETTPQSYDFAIKSAAPVPPAFQALLGKWQSTFDEDEMIEFIPGRYITSYDGQKVVEETMNYLEQCPTDCYPGVETSSYSCFKLADHCFAILYMDQNELRIGMPGMEEESGLVYRKVTE